MLLGEDAISIIMRMFLCFCVLVVSSTLSFSSHVMGMATVEQHRGPFKWAALDLDGTLLNSGHKLSKNTKESLRQLVADGFHIMIATGRAISTVHEHILDLNLDEIPVVCSNGAEGKLCKPALDAEGSPCVQSQTFFSIPVPRTVVETALSEAKKLGFVVQYYVGDDIFANPSAEVAWQIPLCQKYCDLTGSKTKFVTDGFTEAMQQGLPSKLLILCPVEKQDAMIAHFEQTFGEVEETPHLVRGSQGWFMEILQTNKGNGLERMCSHLSLRVEDVVAFGDGDNDIEFIEKAGWGVVMKNGREVVKAVADEVIELSNNDDGVIRTLEAMKARKELTLNY